jgi:hypothetical protein
VTPANDAFSAYPSDVVEEAQRRVRHMVDGGMVQNYNQGGAVQHYAQGDEVISNADLLRGVLPPDDPRLMSKDLQGDMYRHEMSRLSPYSLPGVEGVSQFDERSPQIAPFPASEDDGRRNDLLAFLQAQQGGSGTLQDNYNDLLPMYQDILGSDPKDAQAQMLFDIGQAAFGYAGNVGADGRPMQGSAAARLSQSLGPLAGKIGARAGQMSQEARALKMAALQGAQAKLDKEAMQWRTLSAAEVAEEELDDVYTWQRNSAGELKTLGSRPSVGAVTNISSGADYAATIGQGVGEQDLELAENAEAALVNITKIDDTLRQIDKVENVGIFANFKTKFDQIKSEFLNDPDAGSRVVEDQYLDSLLGSDVFKQIIALGIGARGLDTPAEREFLREVLTGTRTLDAGTLIKMTEARRGQQIAILNRYNSQVERGDLDNYFEYSGRERRLYEIPALPDLSIVFGPVPGETRAQTLARKLREREEKN